MRVGARLGVAPPLTSRAKRGLKLQLLPIYLYFLLKKTIINDFCNKLHKIRFLLLLE